jgi:peroxiredoxin
MRLLRDRGKELEAAGIRPFAISLDHPWSQKAWQEALGAENVTFLSDRLGDAAAALGILSQYQDLPKADHWVYIVDGDTVRASWKLGDPRTLDVDAIVAAASSPSQ